MKYVSTSECTSTAKTIAPTPVRKCVENARTASGVGAAGSPTSRPSQKATPSTTVSRRASVRKMRCTEPNEGGAAVAVVPRREQHEYNGHARRRQETEGGRQELRALAIIFPVSRLLSSVSYSRHAHHVDRDLRSHDSAQARAADDHGARRAHRFAVRAGADRDGRGDRRRGRGDGHAAVERRNAVGGAGSHRPDLHPSAHWGRSA